MRLRPADIKKRAEEAGVGLDQLAEAVARDGRSVKDARGAVANWISGRDHPRCKRRDIDALATALGCLPKDIAKYTSMVRTNRGSQKKVKLVTDMIKGKSFEDASQMLEFSTKRAASNVRKALMAAQADAEQLGADTNELVVSEARVDRGMHIKRFRPKDRGRAHPITKHTSHITVSLQERS